jgi:hypothetical protein
VSSIFAAIGYPDAPIAQPRLRKQADDVNNALLERFAAEFVAAGG